MSIFGAMFSGVTGLSANSQALGMIADNISNVNTIGYKSVAARFSTLVTQQASSKYTPGGVQASPLQHVDRQGLLQSSSSNTDIAIAGAGFFVVNQTAASGNGQFLFTRAGSFDTDQNGDLVNTAGYYLQGWPLINGTTLPSNTSTLSSVQTVNVANLAGTATPTSSVTLVLNLPSTAPAAAGGGQINASISSTLLGGITDIDYKTFGTLNNNARIDYVVAGSTMTIDIGGQIGTFDLSNRLPGVYTSTGTLASMEITLDSSFDFTSPISSTTQTNSVVDNNGVGAEPGNYALATDLTGVTSLSLAGSAADRVIKLAYNNSTGVLTVDDGVSSGTVTIGTSGGTGMKDYTIATGALTGTIVTIDTNTFDYTTAISTTATGVATTGGDLVLATAAVSATFDHTELRNFTADSIAFVVDSVSGAITSTSTAGYSVTVNGANDFDQTAANVTLDVTHVASGEVFTVVVDPTTAAGTADSTVTLTLNELHNANPQRRRRSGGHRRDRADAEQLGRGRSCGAEQHDLQLQRRRQRPSPGRQRTDRVHGRPDHDSGPEHDRSPEHRGHQRHQLLHHHDRRGHRHHPG